MSYIGPTTMKALLATALAAFALTGCAVQADGSDDEPEGVEYESEFVSDVATLMDFEFDGEIAGSTSTNLCRASIG